MGYSSGSSWSISVTDGLSLGVPYVLPNELVCHQWLEKIILYFINTNQECFLKTINDILDDRKP